MSSKIWDEYSTALRIVGIPDRGHSPPFADGGVGRVSAVFTPKGQIASLVPRSGKDTTFGVPRSKLAGPGHLSIQNSESPLGEHHLPFREEE